MFYNFNANTEHRIKHFSQIVVSVFPVIKDTQLSLLKSLNIVSSAFNCDQPYTQFADLAYWFITNNSLCSSSIYPYNRWQPFRKMIVKQNLTK